MAAGAMVGLGVWRGVSELTTSTTTATTTPAPTPSATSGSTTPTSSTVTTTVQTTGSDTLELGLLGAGALFVFMAAFYSRISKITLPGGLGFELSASDTQKLTKKVAQKIRARLPTQAAGNPLTTHGSLRAFSFLSANNLADPEPAATVEESAIQAGKASVLASRYAQQLLRLANSEALLRVRAAELGIVDQADIAALMRGEINDHVADLLAERAVGDAGGGG